MSDDEPLHLVTTTSPDDSGAGASFRVEAHGEVDAATASRLQEQLDRLIEQGASLIILDATGIVFVDSSGLRVIIGCGERLATKGGRLLIEGMSGAVQRVFEIGGLLEKYRSWK